MLKISIRPKAREDIKKIWQYTYQNWGADQAGSYTEKLGQAVESLVDNPQKGIAIDYIRDGYRLSHFQHHYIVYRLTTLTIEIVRVLGESMDIKRHL